MPVSRRNFLKFTGVTALGLGLGEAIAWSGARTVRASAALQTVTDAAPELHVLNRLTWGVRPGDIARIQEMGVQGWIDWQLEPEAIPDPWVDDLLTREPFLTMDAAALDHALGFDQDYTIESRFMWSRLLRATYSERQLYEWMVEFWTDHLNVPVPDLLRAKIIDDREVIRRHAMGRFRDLLFASAQSPAMLYYLNNASSTAEHPNENYAREVMELHTLGVQGGYTEQDVRAVARAFTGWTVRETWPGGFYFDSAMHDTGEKIILGRTLPAGRGIEDGLEVLDLLATHPATARFISLKLVRRFVSDDPPMTLVESAAQVFTQTGGEIRAVLRHILTSPEFMASAGQKFRRPIEFMVAMFRAAGPTLTFGREGYYFVWSTESLGQMPFYWHPPNGYPDAAGAWLNTNGLLNRWNLGMIFPYASQDWLDNVRFDLDAMIPRADTIGGLVDAASIAALGGLVNEADRAALVAFTSYSGDASEAVNAGTRWDRLPALVGLLFSSPYFQWH
jgi:hypothetical protein